MMMIMKKKMKIVKNKLTKKEGNKNLFLPGPIIKQASTVA